MTLPWAREMTLPPEVVTRLRTGADSGFIVFREQRVDVEVRVLYPNSDMWSAWTRHVDIRNGRLRVDISATGCTTIELRVPGEEMVETVVFSER